MMDEREYRIKDGLLQRIIDALKAVVVAYHGVARVVFFGSKRLRHVADEADAAAEALKQEMRKQDGQE